MQLPQQSVIRDSYFLHPHNLQAVPSIKSSSGVANEGHVDVSSSCSNCFHNTSLFISPLSSAWPRSCDPTHVAITAITAAKSSDLRKRWWPGSTFGEAMVCHGSKQRGNTGVYTRLFRLLKLCIKNQCIYKYVQY